MGIWYHIAHENIYANPIRWLFGDFYLDEFHDDRGISRHWNDEIHGVETAWIGVKSEKKMMKQMGGSVDIVGQLWQGLFSYCEKEILTVYLYSEKLIAKVCNGELGKLGSDMRINPTMMRTSSHYLIEVDYSCLYVCQSFSVIQRHFPESQRVTGKTSINKCASFHSYVELLKGEKCVTNNYNWDMNAVQWV